jgi:hypothetical protein
MRRHRRTSLQCPPGSLGGVFIGRKSQFRLAAHASVSILQACSTRRINGRFTQRHLPRARHTRRQPAHPPGKGMEMGMGMALPMPLATRNNRTEGLQWRIRHARRSISKQRLPALVCLGESFQPMASTVLALRARRKSRASRAVLILTSWFFRKQARMRPAVCGSFARSGLPPGRRRSACRSHDSCGALLAGYTHAP